LKFAVYFLFTLSIILNGDKKLERMYRYSFNSSGRNVKVVNSKVNNETISGDRNKASTEPKQGIETITPFRSLVDFAKKHHIPFSEIQLAPKFSIPHPGDTITFLIALFEGDDSEQWLSIIKQDSLTEDEKKLKPMPEDIIYTSTGRKLEFKNTRTALNVYFIGPFSETKDESDEHLTEQLNKPYRTFVSKEQLNLGLDNYGRTAIALTERSMKVNAAGDDLFYIGAPVPLSKEQLEKGQKYFDLIHPTESEERIRFSVTLALDAFLSAALKIKDFSNLLNKVLNRPTIWSVISNFGVDRGLMYNPADVKPFDINNIGINLPAYEQPIRIDLNGKPALNARIIMTEARPPWQACAGIVKIYAENPVDHDVKLVMQVIAARVGR
jgi:hypothetical protein